MTKIGSAFLPVGDPAAASAWFQRAFGLTEQSVDSWSAVLRDGHGGRLTLLGPASGVKAQPGLPWATHNLIVDDLDAVHARLAADGHTTTELTGDPGVCRFFTVPDLDGNVLLVVDR
ncbi:VOC family protein [Catellatospora sp. KI3]|uniref:VOC family protein n=1 Tax=Catellatospora sp. KI3 TaxID=3041620 RepID=UPI002482D6AF|nr:VOC family protein [Catellatospora sp. KI3]MDI1465696.1 VOC family protein [Catellatospora sp. KI3]